MSLIPKAAEPLVSAFSVAFTRPTFQRVTLLIVGAILAMRQRTVTAMLRTLGPLAKGHWSDFHRVLCCRVWSVWPLGKVLTAMVLELVPADQPAVVLVDDTNPQHRGNHVYGRGCHRDACRSSSNHMVAVWGHKWVTLAIRVSFPFCARPWALPVLCALYRPEELNAKEGHRHKTTIDLAMQLVATLIHWFPQRKFVLVGDGGYASHELARFCLRHRRHVALISRFYPQANIYQGPPTNAAKRRAPRGHTGRHQVRRQVHVRGRRLPAPAAVVKRSQGKRFTVDWYGGGQRQVELIWGEGGWYRARRRAGLVPVRWVFVRDRSGTHREEYLFSTDPAVDPEAIVGLFTGRWSIEVTFQEVRAHLGFATVRNWSKRSVLRTAPCLLGLFSLVSLVFAKLTAAKAGKAEKAGKRPGTRPTIASAPWYPKTQVTFSDAMRSVRRLCWGEVFVSCGKHAGVTHLPRPLRLMLLEQLSQSG